MDILLGVLEEYKVAISNNDLEKINDKGKLLSNLTKFTSVSKEIKHEIRTLLRKYNLYISTDYLDHPLKGVIPDRSWTIVTMFFDLAAFENNSIRRTSTEYLNLGRETLSLPYDKVIYTEERFVDTCRSMALQANGGKFKIITVDFENIPTWHLYNKFKEGFVNNPLKNGEGHKNTPSYSCLVNAKHDFMYQVINENPFNSSYFCWVDFGLSHIVNFRNVNIDYILDTSPREIRMLQMTTTHLSEIINRKDFYSRLRGKLGAGFVTGRKDEWLKFIELCKAELEKLLSLGIQGNEEQIWSCVEAENPEIFRHAYGDYDTTLSNYNNVKSKLKCVIWNLEHSLRHNMLNHAIDVCDIVIDSLYGKSLNATRNEITSFLKIAESIYSKTGREEGEKTIKDLRALMNENVVTKSRDVIDLFIGCVIAYS